MDFNKHVFHIFSENAYERKREVTESELSKPNKNKIEVKGGSQITRRWISY